MAFKWFYYKAFVSRNANMLCVVVVTNKWCYLNCTVLLKSLSRKPGKHNDYDS